MRWLIIVVAACPLWGLKFDRLRNADKRSVLLVYDCEKLPLGRDCQGFQNEFSEGDSGRLERELANPAEEVWLYSYGGDLAEGILMGRVLRSRGMTVRVPSMHRIVDAMERSGRPWPKEEKKYQVRCVSACTVAFMGGLFRYVDEDSTYEVHSGSGFGSLKPELISGLEEKPEETFQLLSIVRHRNAMATGAKLLGLFQNTLVQTLPESRRPAGCDSRFLFSRDVRPWCENDAEIEAWSRRFQPDYSTEQLRQDMARFRSEGKACLQDILMRMERQSMAVAISHFRSQIHRLGARAEAALRMVEVMYEVSIKEVDVLPRETMYRMGYLSRELQ